MSSRLAFPRSATLMLGLASVVVAACTRTPPEPAPVSAPDAPALTGERPTAALAVPVASGPASPRCIASTPSSAPALPPAAPASECPRDPEGIPKAEKAEVSFPEAAGTPHVDVELATSEHDIQRGLMYRTSMPESHGMLFRLDGRREHTFWMHNTCISLDMLFVDEDGTVVGIVEGAKPLDDASRTVGCPSRYVLEVNAGWTRRHGVRAGQKMALPATVR
jgi:uncharacterized membrane protein (UPF0127 family)